MAERNRRAGAVGHHGQAQIAKVGDLGQDSEFGGVYEDGVSTREGRADPRHERPRAGEVEVHAEGHAVFRQAVQDRRRGQRPSAADVPCREFAEDAERVAGHSFSDPEPRRGVHHAPVYVVGEAKGAGFSRGYLHAGQVHVGKAWIASDPFQVLADYRNWRRRQASARSRQGHVQGSAAEQLDSAAARVGDLVTGDVPEDPEDCRRRSRS